GIGGFFAQRRVEVEGRAPETPAVPPQKLFDADDAAPGQATAEELRSPVVDAMLAQAEPLPPAPGQAAPAQPAEPAPTASELPEPGFRELDAPANELPVLIEDETDFAAVRARLAELGMPEAAIEPVIREAERGMRPFDQDATPEQLVRRAFAK